LWRFNHPAGSDFYEVVRLERARMLRNLRRRQPALDDLNWLAENYPRIPEIFAERGDLLFDDGKTEEAMSDAAHALALEPLGEPQRILKLKILERQKRADEAIRLADDIIRRGGTVAAIGDAYYYRGWSHKHKKEVDQAQADMEEAFARQSFYRTIMFQRMIEHGYYEGTMQDEYSMSAHNGLRACIIDPDC
jgi:tetratricopeptide (TPR) repeat protein